MNKTIEILCGIPCSGKSTYVSNQLKSNLFSFAVSRDSIRETLFGKYYKQNNRDEKLVTSTYNNLVELYVSMKITEKIILDNTHCREKYIDEIIRKYGETNTIVIKFFECSLIKAHYRNVIRYIKTDKWIPISVINSMYKHFKNINRKKYTKYLEL